MNKTKTNSMITQKQWLKHFAAQRDSGLTTMEYCKLKQLLPQQFYNAKNRYRKKRVPAPGSRLGAFKRIAVLPDASVVPHQAMIPFRAGSVNFEILEGAPAGVIAKILIELNRRSS